MTADRTPAPRDLIATAISDLVSIAAFAVVGRSAHGLALDAPGIVETAWPFAAACAVAWAALLALRVDPSRVWPGGVAVWLATVAGGLGLRLLSGETAAVAFVIVATLVLGALLLITRAAQALGRRARARAAGEDRSTAAR